MKHRSLRRYEGRRVFITLDNESGMRGILDRVYRDHLLIVEAQGAAVVDGEMQLEPQSGATDAVLRSRVVRVRLDRE